MDRDRPRIDRDLRELLTNLRDTFRDAAARIDDYLVRNEAAPPARPRGGFYPRDNANAREGGREGAWRDRDRDNTNWRDEPREHNDRPRGDYHDGGDPPEGVHYALEKLREEVRWISGEAARMEPALLRLYIEAVTAETRLLQARATDPADNDIAAKIMRALTAIVSDHRPGHVYGLARHHQADWADVARRARAEIKSRGGDERPGDEGGPHGDEGPRD
jgi:hypothetical protein